ncbi:PREDICTED: BBSome-interacting protein 1 [Wasmannia auropunctata]|uniref:BBSome-interacting protein 1 n=1 Tax=Wasmannia auropunctata TaxID=64793 RepID=UPI0005EF5E79|nr:PREDICTED: BBSome-interacting protein 1 [Wasmannia auropunctata]XP_011685026.1 PREDICTED: BBSome-interacting protein 1 [Wasmannia auropunctata]XP_011685027.1 PREDICTED: BBSome-interacting protein 1 [Wasmannia auropunctata]
MSEPTDSSNQVEQCDIVLPRQGLLYQTDALNYILCKPKLIPLKSVTLEKLERMQRDAEIKVKEAQEAEGSLDTASAVAQDL